MPIRYALAVPTYATLEGHEMLIIVILSYPQVGYTFQTWIWVCDKAKSPGLPSSDLLHLGILGALVHAWQPEERGSCPPLGSNVSVTPIRSG
jgi:hypothetical protein